MVNEKQKEEIYKEIKVKKQKEYVEELRERSTIVLGYLMLPLYILVNAFIAGVGFLMYLVAVGKDVILIEFVDNPLGASGDMAIIVIVVFLFWLMFGFYSIFLYKKAKKLMKEKKEKYKKLKIWRW